MEFQEKPKEIGWILKIKYLQLPIIKDFVYMEVVENLQEKELEILEWINTNWKFDIALSIRAIIGFVLTIIYDFNNKK